MWSNGKIILMSGLEDSKAFYLCVLPLGKDVNWPQSPCNDLMTVTNVDGKQLNWKRDLFLVLMTWVELVKNLSVKGMSKWEKPCINSSWDIGKEKNRKMKVSDFRKVGFSKQEFSCNTLEFKKSRSYLREHY